MDPADDPEYLSTFVVFFDSPTGSTLPVGCISLCRSPTSPEISEIRSWWVQPNHREGGVGRMLLQQAVLRARFLSQYVQARVRSVCTVCARVGWGCGFVRKGAVVGGTRSA